MRWNKIKQCSWFKMSIRALWFCKPWEKTRCKNDEVYYFKEVGMLGPVHFISHWTWTITFYVFLFRGLVWESGAMTRQSQRRVVPGTVLCLLWSVCAELGRNTNVQSSFLILYQGRSRSLKWYWLMAFVHCLCKILQTTWVSRSLSGNLFIKK